MIAGQGEIELIPLIGVVWLCAVLGDTTSFYIGRRLGRGFLREHGPRVKITHERLEQVEGYFDRHGGKTILIGRFIGLVRALAPFIAGSLGPRLPALPPVQRRRHRARGRTLFCVLGYIFWRSFDKVAHLVGQAIFGFAVTVAVIVGVVTAYRRREEIHAWLLRTATHPLVKPLFVIGAAAVPLDRPPAGPTRRRRRLGSSRTGSCRASWGWSSPRSGHRRGRCCTSSSGTSWSCHGISAHAARQPLLDLAHRPERQARRRGQGGHRSGRVADGPGDRARTSVLLIMRRRYPEAVVLLVGLRSSTSPSM